MTTETKEKDNFWLIVGGVVAAAILTMVLIKSNEHGKYVSTANAIAEDASYVAHKSENK
jgi:uncharacterized protein (UPF0333 family)